MNWDYFFKLTPINMAIQAMLKEHYDTDLTFPQEVRFAQFEEYFSALEGSEDKSSTWWH